MTTLPSIYPANEIAGISAFIKKTLREAGKKRVVVAVSGGIDSVVTLFLLTRALPKEHIFAIHLPYEERTNHLFQAIIQQAGVLPHNIFEQNIDQVIKKFANEMPDTDDVRLGNVMARVRMIFLYDFAKKIDALVVGTENKSEYYLGYFTRFGDEASDIEIIRHLYKTQVYEMAKFLIIPEKYIKQEPTAGLWSGQTDEKELGFSYREADPVLYLHFEKNKSIKELQTAGYSKVVEILHRAKKNEFKHHTPFAYTPRV